jgi:hypothetical protein
MAPLIPPCLWMLGLEPRTVTELTVDSAELLSSYVGDISKNLICHTIHRRIKKSTRCCFLLRHSYSNPKWHQLLKKLASLICLYYFFANIELYRCTVHLLKPKFEIELYRCTVHLLKPKFEMRFDLCRNFPNVNIL